MLPKYSFLRILALAVSSLACPLRACATDLLFVVEDPGNLSSQESARRTLIESWGFTVTLIDDGASQAAFDVAAAANDVAYVPAAMPDSPLGTKLRNTPIGVVIEAEQTFDEFGFSSHPGDDGGVNIQIVDDSHYITRPFSIGVLNILTSSGSLAYLHNTNGGGVQTLAIRPTESAKEMLAVIDEGGALYAGGVAAGPRAKLPWGNATFGIGLLNDDGRTLMRRALEWAGGLYEVSGTVFEDADFDGIATDWDGGLGDVGQPSVDVELYDNTGTYIMSTATDGSGGFLFSELVNGTYRVRVRSATLGDADTPPAGGFNATVPGTWPYPLPDMTWADGSLIGGQDPAIDDTATGDNAGPGDTYASVTLDGADLSDVNFGFCYDLIVNEDDDASSDNLRSKQGSLRQFIKNSNAIAGVNRSQFQIPSP